MVVAEENDDLECIILPLVKLAGSKTIEMGPVKFWPAKEYDKYIKANLSDDFKKYLDKSILTIHTRQGCFNLEPEDITCATIKMTFLLDKKQKYSLMNDATQMLCFLSNFSIHGIKTQNIHNIYAFKHIRTVWKDLFNTPENWGTTSWFFLNINKKVEISITDKDLSECFGKILATNYMLSNSRWTRRIIQAIRYFNLIFWGEEYQNEAVYQEIYYAKPEDIVFLSMAFEALLDLHFGSPDRKDTTKKFVNSIITILNVPSEKLIRKMKEFLENFYKLRSDVIHGDDILGKDFSTVKGAHVFYATLIDQLQTHTCLKPDILREIRSKSYLTRLFQKVDILGIIKELLPTMVKREEIRDISDEKLHELDILVKLFNNICKEKNKYYLEKSNRDEVCIAVAIKKTLNKSSKSLESVKDVLEKKDLVEIKEFMENLETVIEKSLQNIPILALSSLLLNFRQSVRHGVSGRAPG